MTLWSRLDSEKVVLMDEVRQILTAQRQRGHFGRLNSTITHTSNWIRQWARPAPLMFTDGQCPYVQSTLSENVDWTDLKLV